MKKSNYSTMFLWFGIIVFVAVLLLLGVVIYKQFTCAETKNLEIISTFLVFLGFSASIAYAVPVFLAKNQIESIAGELIHRKFIEEYSLEQKKLMNEQVKNYSHTCRMIATLITKDTNLKPSDYWWAIGWATNSLKYYIEYIDGNLAKKDKGEFLDQIHSIISQCFTQSSTYKLEKDSSGTKIKKDTENNLVAIRAVKDFIDVMFKFNYKFDVPNSKKIILNKIINISDCFCDNDVFKELIKDNDIIKLIKQKSRYFSVDHNAKKYDEIIESYQKDSM